MAEAGHLDRIGVAVGAHFPTVTAALRTAGHATVEGAQLRSALVPSRQQWDRFTGHWDDLVLDQYVGEEPSDQFRYRRYGRLGLHPTGAAGIELRELAGQPFQQAAEHIPRYGGRPRALAPLTAEFVREPVLLQLVAIDYGMLPGLEQAYEVGLHLIRVRTRAGLDSRPTPEGRHRDGHVFVAMHLIGRSGCRGGESHIYQPGTDPPVRLCRVTLSTPLDTIVVDDAAVEHEVTRLEPVAEEGTRDVLLVTFDRADGSIDGSESS